MINHGRSWAYSCNDSCIYFFHRHDEAKAAALHGILVCSTLICKVRPCTGSHCVHHHGESSLPEIAINVHGLIHFVHGEMLKTHQPNPRKKRGGTLSNNWWPKNLPHSRQSKYPLVFHWLTAIDAIQGSFCAN